MRTWATLLGSGVLAAGLAGCAMAAGAGTDASPRTITLTVDGYAFVPNHVEVTRGETVSFVVVNPTDVAHEIYIGTQAEQAADEFAHQSAAPMAQAMVSTGMGYGEYVPAYSTVDFEYTFSSRAEVMIGCHLPGHWAKGMQATITVH